MSVARVIINDVEAGSVPTDLYLGIVKQVKSDKRIWLSQILNTLWVAYRCLYSGLMLVPTFWFICLIFSLFFIPGLVAETLDYLSVVLAAESFSSQKLIAQLKFSVVWSWVFSSGALFIYGAMTAGQFPGYTDHFAEEINRRIRRQLDITSTGTMQVTYTVASSEQ